MHKQAAFQIRPLETLTNIIPSGSCLGVVRMCIRTRAVGRSLELCPSTRCHCIHIFFDGEGQQWCSATATEEHVEVVTIFELVGA